MADDFDTMLPAFAGTAEAGTPPSGEALRRAPSRDANRLVVLLFLAYLCSGLDRLILPLMVGPVKQTLNINDTQIGLLQGVAFGLCYAFAGLPMGWLVDRVRRTWLLAGSIFLWTSMTLLSGFARSFLVLFLARMGLGLCEAALAPAGYSLIGGSFDRRRLVRANAIFVSGSVVCVGIAYFLVGQVTEWLTGHAALLKLYGFEPWQATFVVVGLPGIILVPFLLSLREPPRSDKAPALGMIAAWSYIWRRRRDYAPFYAATIFLGIPNYSGMNWFPTHIMRYFHADPKHTGLAVGIVQFVGAVGGTILGASLTGRFVRRGKPDAHIRTILVISLCSAVGMLAPLMPNETVALCFWFVAVFGFTGYASSCMGALQILSPSNVIGSNIALILMTSVLAGQVGGTALVGAMADHLFPGVPAGIGISLSIIGVLSGLTSFACAFSGRKHFAALMRMSENRID